MTCNIRELARSLEVHINKWRYYSYSFCPKFIYAYTEELYKQEVYDEIQVYKLVMVQGPLYIL